MFLKAWCYMVIVGSVISSDYNWGERKPGDKVLAKLIVKRTWYKNPKSFATVYPQDDTVSIFL